MDVCIGLALGAVLLRLPSPVTLAWQHSVEHVAIEEDWQATAEGLVLRETRVGGPGAGIDIPDTARLVAGTWRYAPTLPPQSAVQLANSEYVRGYRVCAAGHCTALPPGRPLVLARCMS
jgi:hypothetical protein